MTVFTRITINMGVDSTFSGIIDIFPYFIYIIS
jgi:hypothetical protein